MKAADRARELTKKVMATPFHLLLRHLCNDVIWHEDNITPFFAKYSSMKEIEIWPKGDNRDAGAVVKFSNKEEVFQAAQEFHGQTKWGWNHGFRVKVTGMKEHRAYDNGLGWFLVFQKPSVLGVEDTPDFLGDSPDDDLEAVGPGYMLLLPEYGKRKPGTEMGKRSPERSFTADICGHPVIVTWKHENGLVNIVLCSTFHDRTPSGLFNNRCSPLKDFIEIDSVKNGYEQSYAARCGNPLEVPSDVLIFQSPEGGFRQKPKRRGFAKTRPYTVDLRTLARLPHYFTDEPPVGGYLEIGNLDILLKKMETLEVDYKAEHPLLLVKQARKEQTRNPPITKEPLKMKAAEELKVNERVEVQEEIKQNELEVQKRRLFCAVS